MRYTYLYLFTYRYRLKILQMATGSGELYSASRRKAGKVLVVDDEPDILLICTKALSYKNFEVEGFSNSVEAFEHFKVKSSDYDLVLTDVRMPIMSGFELAKEIRNIRPDITILFMTAFETFESEYEGVFSSADSSEFISKPFSITKLEQLVCSHIKRS